MEMTSYGPHAVLLRLAGQADDEAFRRGRALAGELGRHLLPGLREIVPAFTTLLLDFEPGTDGRRNEALLAEVLQRDPGGLRSADSEDGRIIEVPVHYDGPDLVRVAGEAGLAVAEVIARHAAPAYRVHCLGFAPAFRIWAGLTRACIRRGWTRRVRACRPAAWPLAANTPASTAFRAPADGT